MNLYKTHYIMFKRSLSFIGNQSTRQHVLVFLSCIKFKVWWKSFYYQHLNNQFSNSSLGLTLAYSIVTDCLHHKSGHIRLHRRTTNDSNRTHPSEFTQRQWRRRRFPYCRFRCTHQGDNKYVTYNGRKTGEKTSYSFSRTIKLYFHPPHKRTYFSHGFLTHKHTNYEPNEHPCHWRFYLG